MAKKARADNLNIEELLKSGIRHIKKEKAMDYDKPLNILDFAEKLLAENLTAGQRVIMKFYYAGSRFNEDLRIDAKDLEVIKSFDIDQTWITHGEHCKLNWHAEYLNSSRREEEYNNRNQIYEKVVRGEFIKEEELQFKPLWFLDLILVLGRRSGKSYLSSLISSYEAYKLLMLKDPQKFYKTNAPIYIINTATSAEQAESIIFTEVKNFIKKCPAFDGRIGKNTQNELHILTDSDLEGYGVSKAEDHMQGKIILKSGSSNSAGLRGKTAIVVIYDEMAHFTETNGVGSGKEVYNALSRSSATFKILGDGRQIVLSSPYTPSGQFYDLYVDSKTEPSMLMFQVPTWNINPRVPKSILESEFRQDPELAATEYGAQFLRRSDSIYFSHEKVDLAMESGRMMQSKGNPAYQYFLHIDAAETSDRYAFMLAHLESRFDRELRQNVQYVVEDYSKFIKPISGNHLDPDAIVDDYILPLFSKFNIVCVSFDGVFTREQRKKISYRCPSLLELRFAGKQKFDIYANTRNLLMSNRIELCAEDVELQGELKNIIVDHSRKHPTVDKNPDAKDFPHDDLVDCLCGVAYAMTLGREGAIRLPRVAIARTGVR